MAGPRRSSLAKKKKPIVRVTQKAKEQFKEMKKNSGEPAFTDAVLTRSQLIEAYNWYNVTYSTSEAKAFIYTYLKNVGRDKEASQIRSISDKWVSTTAGWICRLRSNGTNLPESTKVFFEERLDEMLVRDPNKGKMEASSDDEPPKSKKLEKATVQDKIQAKVSDYICLVEEEIDNFINNGYKSNFNPYEHMKANELPPLYAKKVFDFYDPQLTEIEHAYNNTDAEIAEGYQGYKPKNLEALYDLYVMLVEDAERYSQNEKKARKPRTKKPVSVEKKLQNFKYMTEDISNKLVSIAPEKILGAGELWVFSTKYNQLTVFRNVDPSGLDINRTAIIGFDPSTSSTKKLKAKDVQTILQNVLTGGKIVLRNLMKDIRGSDQRLQERMNENTILLRVVPR